MSALCGDGREGSDWRGLELNLDLSAIAREGAWGLRLQTKGQRKNAEARKALASVLRRFVFFKVCGTKSLKPEQGCERAEKDEGGGVPKNWGAFRIERST